MHIKHTIINFLLVQIFATLISLPILVGWGLPLSLVAPLGNIVFSPFLTLYLVCAFFVFFTEFLSLPNSIFVLILERITDVWLWILTLLKQSMHIGFISPPFIFLCILGLLPCIVLWCLRRRSSVIIIIWLSLLFLCICLFLYAIAPSSYTFSVIREGKKVVCTINKNQIALIDTDSAFSKKAAADEWIIYHLLPQVTAKTGATALTHCVLFHPRQRTFEAITALSKQQVSICNFYIPRWKGMLHASAWRAYLQMCDAINAAGSKLTIFEDNFSFSLSNTTELSFMATGKYKKYNDVTYQIFTLSQQQVDSLDK